MLCIEGVTILSFYRYWMHCKSLGIDKPLLGSVLYVLIHYILPGDLKKNLQEVWDDIQEAYEDIGSENRSDHMRRAMFTTKSQPKLKGKAAEVRDLGPVMMRVWRKHMNANLLIHQMIVVALESSLV